ncbi:MAG: DNA repair and recombination protein RadA [Promethearchaeota archaeon]
MSDENDDEYFSLSESVLGKQVVNDVVPWDDGVFDEVTRPRFEINGVPRAGSIGNSKKSDGINTGLQLKIENFSAPIDPSSEIMDFQSRQEREILLSEIDGIGKRTVNRLKTHGFLSARSVATLSSRALQDQCGIGTQIAKKIINSARDLCGITFMTADELFERRRHVKRISTGSKCLDEMLGGGIETGAVTEFIGEYGTGKSQIAFQLCLNVQLSDENGGVNGKAMFIDTEGTFRPERLVQMAAPSGVAPRKILQNVIYAHAFNHEHQINIVNQARRMIESKNVKLLVVDSIISHFRSEFCGIDKLIQRQQKLNKHLHQIRKLAETYMLAAVVTNHVQTNPNIMFGNQAIPTGGNVMAHGVTYRVFLMKRHRNTRIARLIGAPGLPEGEAAFLITACGIKDK